MNISREMHEWFKSIDGKTNDDKMGALEAYKADSEFAWHLLKVKCDEQVMCYEQIDRSETARLKLKRENSTLKKMLTVSIIVSWSAAICLAYAQGWFV